MYPGAPGTLHLSDSLGDRVPVGTIEDLDAYVENGATCLFIVNAANKRFDVKGVSRGLEMLIRAVFRWQRTSALDRQRLPVVLVQPTTVCPIV